MCKEFQEASPVTNPSKILRGQTMKYNIRKLKITHKVCNIICIYHELFTLIIIGIIIVTIIS